MFKRYLASATLMIAASIPASAQTAYLDDGPFGDWPLAESRGDVTAGLRLSVPFGESRDARESAPSVSFSVAAHMPERNWRRPVRELPLLDIGVMPEGGYVSFADTPLPVGVYVVDAEGNEVAELGKTGRAVIIGVGVTAAVLVVAVALCAADDDCYDISD